MEGTFSLRSIFVDLIFGVNKSCTSFLLQGEWLKEQYKKKHAKLREEGINPDSGPPTEKEIILQVIKSRKAARLCCLENRFTFQERLPESLEDYTDPLRQWVTVPSCESKVPSWTKSLLRQDDPEKKEPSEKEGEKKPPPSPVKINQSLSQWLNYFTDEKDRSQRRKTKIEIDWNTVIGVREALLTKFVAVVFFIKKFWVFLF